MTTENKLIIQYKNFNNEMKQYFFKQSLKDNTDSYNESKTFFKNKNTDELTTKYYNIQIKNYMNKVFLLNSIIKNDKENIIKNFKNSNIHLLDFMEIIEELSMYSINDDDHFMDEDGECFKIGEYYRQQCNTIKEEYDFFNYIIENDLK